jgi:hypothetical protein
MTWELDTELDVYLRWIIGNGHGVRIRGDDRWSLSKTVALGPIVEITRNAGAATRV